MNMINQEYILEHFKFNHHGTANSESTVLGEKYRFTILTDRFIRMEYSDEGVFEDRPSQTFFHRYMDKPDYKVELKNDFLEISTEYLLLKYLLFR